MRMQAAILGLVLLTLGAGSARAEFTLRGFADLEATAHHDRGPTASRFGLGQLDFFVAGRVSQSITFLNENVLEFDEAAGDFVYDLERLQAKYRHRDWLSIGIGKVHTPLGYWNTEFHHGKVFHTTIERPNVFRFEDEGGPLPIHNTGIFFEGSHLGAWHFSYDVLVANGIGGTPVGDNNPQKSVTLRLGMQPVPAVRLGVSGYFDHIAAGTGRVVQLLEEQSGVSQLATNPSEADETQRFVQGNIDQAILNGFAVMGRGPVTVMGEYFRIMDRSGGDHNSDVGYAFASYSRGRATPYARYDFANYGAKDPYYTMPDVGDLILGVRVDTAELSAIKGEVRFLKSEQGGAEATAQEFVIQYAFGF